MESANVVNNRERLPSDMTQVITVAKYDILKHLRSKRLFGLLVIEGLLLGLMFALPILLNVSTTDDPAKYMSSFVGWVDLLLVLGVTMFAGDSIVSEFQNRTGYLLFPNPVKREVIFLGKYLSTLSIVFVMLLSYYGVAAILTLVSTGGGTELWLYSMLFAMCYGVAAAALGFFLSSIFKGSTGALVLTFFTLLMILPLVQGIFMINQTEPTFVLTYASGPISYLMSSPYPTGDYIPDVGTSLVVIAIYTLVLLVLGLLFFKRREMVS
ncbi:MAG: ABC transporter permease, partial [Methanomassiliicoccales archaeon]|nr:ABC transporter permease [Methanomassiliicoccales archaeon]